jgi:UDPglucose 6-dehydrogenase
VDNGGKRTVDLKNGTIPLTGLGLTDIVERSQRLGRLHFTTDLKDGLDHSLIIFLAVGTPSASNGSSDISAVLSVANEIAENMSEYHIIAAKSTVPVGTHKKMADLIRSKTHVPFDYVSNPEFLKEGTAVEDFMRPDRIIIGTTSPSVRAIMKQVYGPFMRRQNRILFMDPASAEMTKYAANTMLATRISFMNEISVLCEELGADVELVRQGLGSDSRIGSAFLFPGIGYGGSCFPKDIRALIHTGTLHGVEMRIAKAVQQVNADQQERFTQRILDYFRGREKQTTLAVWGLAFKAGTDDVRESPAIYSVKKLLDCQMKIRAYDPEASSAAMMLLEGGISVYQNGYDALDDSDALIIFTDWQEFRNPDFGAIAKRLKTPTIFDGRNLYDPAVTKEAGIEYHSIGRAPDLKLEALNICP